MLKKEKVRVRVSGPSNKLKFKNEGDQGDAKAMDQLIPEKWKRNEKAANAAHKGDIPTDQEGH